MWYNTFTLVSLSNTGDNKISLESTVVILVTYYGITIRLIGRTASSPEEPHLAGQICLMIENLIRNFCFALPIDLYGNQPRFCLMMLTKWNVLCQKISFFRSNDLLVAFVSLTVLLMSTRWPSLWLKLVKNLSSWQSSHESQFPSVVLVTSLLNLKERISHYIELTRNV